MLMTLMISTSLMIGQRAPRSDAHENSERTAVKAKQAAQQRSTQPAKRANNQQVQRQKTYQPASRANNQQVQRQKTYQPVSRSKNQQVERQKVYHPEKRNANQQAQRQKTTHHVRTDAPEPVVPENRKATRHEAMNDKLAYRERPVSISTNNNPRSTYRSSDSKVYARKHNKYSEKRYYSGHYYHHVYPTRRVNIHYHHDTYAHNYHVLYYPAYTDVYWNRNMYRDYMRWYPNYHWRYDYGYRIQTISVFNAKYNLGEVAMVYGRVYATWYNDETDDYLLFFGGDYPSQQFTVVLPGRVARKFNWRPERYFLGEHLTVTGLITTFDGIPEIIVKNGRQVGIY